MNLLFPSKFERLATLDALIRALEDARERVNQGAVLPTFDRGLFERLLEGFDFKDPLSLDHVLVWTIQQMETGLTHIAHPRYFGLFNPTPTFPAQCADLITAVFNPQLATSTTSPAATAIEAHVIRAMTQRFGLPPDATGHFTTGGAEANYTALLLALTRAKPAFAKDGAAVFRRPTFYISADSHLAWLKIAHQAGIGRSAVRLVNTDGQGQMNHAALMAMIEEDYDAGCQPIMIVATAGTTNAGMIDPLRDCAALARHRHLWFHVDAAWGGGAIASDKHKSCLAGIDLADSITVDAHKWFAATMGCGMLLTRWPALLAETFQVSTSYMPSNLGADPYVNSVQWSRRFLGLRLFLSLAVAGWQGYGAHVERTLELAEHLKGRLLAKGWRVCNQSPLGVICTVPPDTTSNEVVDRVLASGNVWVSRAKFEGQDVVRACVTSGETSEYDIAVLMDCLEGKDG